MRGKKKETKIKQIKSEATFLDFRKQKKTAQFMLTKSRYYPLKKDDEESGVIYLFLCLHEPKSNAAPFQ